ncbi:hypothetical protein [Sporosarcina sp.]|uniref:hypothetical protein n=1 Tax=Sporosarcina sp. TaxID=49982 RepID=UPI00262BC878|nr:hypothetical protein [Sporosarcina sp.]
MTETAILRQQCKSVHQAPLEHQIGEWIRNHLVLLAENDYILCYDFPKDKVELFYAILNEAHAEKAKNSSRPWKYLPIPEETNYPYPIAQYEKEYGQIYYESLYKYITALGVILNIFDFEKHRLVISIR